MHAFIAFSISVMGDSLIFVAASTAGAVLALSILSSLFRFILRLE